MRTRIVRPFETQSARVAWAFVGLAVLLVSSGLGIWLSPRGSVVESVFNVGLLVGEATAAVLIGIRVVLVSRERVAWGAMSLALVVLTVRGVVEEIGRRVGPTEGIPAISLTLYVLFGVLVFVALALIIRSRVVHVSVSVWLDGLIAALGLLTVVSYFTLTPGETLQRGELAELLYPSIPLIFVAMLVAASLALDRPPSPAWWLQLVAASLMSVSAVFHSNGAVAGEVAAGSSIDVIWGLATALIALAAWISPAPPMATDPTFRGIVVAPAVFSVAALVVLVFNELGEGSSVTEYLAFAALAAGLLRLLISVADTERLRRREMALSANLERARDAALDAAAAKSAFLATMSHEIRTPLNAVLGMNELLLDTDIDATQRSYVEKASLSGSLLLELLTDILDFSKIEVGAIELEWRPFDLKRLVVASAHVLSFAAESKQLEIVVDYAEDSPKHVVGDATRLRQVLVNLLGNAVKFTHDGEVRLSVARGDEPGSVRFEVADTGIGIHPEQLAYLFEPFTQADQTTTRLRGGTGLGLSICQSLVGLMGGAIEVDTAPGTGSRFSFEILLEEVAPVEHKPVIGVTETGGDVEMMLVDPLTIDGGRHADDDADSSTREAPSSGAVPRQLKVLVAEDNPTLQFLSTRLVAKIGHVASTVSNGADAVAAVRREAFDIILMDVHMPTMDGLEATRRIRAVGTTIVQPRIIALTAGATTHDRDGCFEAGMDDYISKPFTSRDLQQAFLAVELSVPPVVSSAAVVDGPPSVLDDLDPAERVEVLQAFVAQGRRDLLQLARALAGEHAEDPRFVAHRLRGGSLSIGAVEVAESCLVVESMSSDEAAAPGPMSHLHDTLEAAIVHIDTELHAHPSP